MKVDCINKEYLIKIYWSSTHVTIGIPGLSHQINQCWRVGWALAQQKMQLFYRWAKAQPTPRLYYLIRDKP